MNTDAISHCLNCGTDLHGMVFCGNCGQRNIHRRLVWRSLLEDLNVHIFEWDLPWLKTIRDLTIRPGKVCSDYADGRRIIYVNPVKYVFYILAIIVIIFGLNKPLEPYEIRFGGITQGFLDMLPASLRFLFTNIPVYMLLMSPVAVLIFRLIFWRSARNWVEISCFVFYMIGHCTLLIALMDFVQYLVDPILSSFMTYGKSSGVELMFFILFILPFYVAFTSMYFYKSRLDWSFIGSMIGVLSYMFICYTVPAYLSLVYLPIGQAYAKFLYEFSLL